jgi:hypothetical protein
MPWDPMAPRGVNAYAVGPDLDVAVALEVMGAQWYSYASGMVEGGYMRCVDDDPADAPGSLMPAIGDEPIGFHRVRPYSTKIDAAWLVIRRLNAMMRYVPGKDHAYGLRVTVDQDWHGCPIVTVHRCDLYVAQSLYDRGSEPAAICRAALAAVRSGRA